MAQTIRRRAQTGFSLVEMLVAITVTLIIMGSVYGLMTQSQNAFGREPLLADRQQQVRIAMDRIQKDILVAGMSLGSYTQAFATDLNALGPLGVNLVGDSTSPLGGGNSDILEIRGLASDCPPVRTDPAGALAGEKIQTIESIPECVPDPGWVFMLYPDARAKLGWLTNHPTGTDDVSTFPATQPDGSQISGDNEGPTHLACSVWFGTQGALTSPNGSACPPAPVPPTDPDAPPATMKRDTYGCPACLPYGLQAASVVRYQIGTDTNGTVTVNDDIPSLFRNANGGVDSAGALTSPPGAGWQLVARGIEDLQVEYRSASAGWANTPVLIAEAAATNIVQEVRVTLWARAVGVRSQEANNVGDGLQGETRAPGNLVMAVRGSLVTTIAPRAAQRALALAAQWK